MDDNATGAVGIPAVTRADVEQAIWSLTGWQGDQAAVDALLVVIDAYAALMAGNLKSLKPAAAESYAHLLATFAAELTGAGGRVRLVPSAVPALEEALGAVRASLPQPPPAAKASAPAAAFTCRSCGVARRPEDFDIDRARPTGRKSICKACRQKRAAAARERKRATA